MSLNIFLYYNCLTVKKGVLPYLLEQESTINAEEFLFQVRFTQRILCILEFAYDFDKDTATRFDQFDV